MRAANAPQALIDKYQVAAELPPDQFRVHESSKDDLRLFIGMETQWQMAAGGQFAATMGASMGQIDSRRVALVYASLYPVARAMRIKVTEERFNAIREMEAAALDEFVKIERERQPRQ